MKCYHKYRNIRISQVPEGGNCKFVRINVNTVLHQTLAEKKMEREIIT